MEKSNIVRREVGEIMVYTAMRSIYFQSELFTHNSSNSNEGMDSVTELFSNNSDEFAGCHKHASNIQPQVYLHHPRKEL